MDMATSKGALNWLELTPGRPSLSPMKPPVPKDESAYGFEVLWQGVRAVALVEGGRARVHDSEGADVSEQFAELRTLGPALGSR